MNSFIQNINLVSTVVEQIKIVAQNVGLIKQIADNSIEVDTQDMNYKRAVGGLNINISSGDYIKCYPLSDGVMEILLPSSPVGGDTIVIEDIDGGAKTNFIEVNRNGKKINGDINNISITYSFASIKLIYADSDTGWRIIER